MTDYIYDRVLRESLYIINNKATVQTTGRYFGICKSTVHKDMTERLPYINKSLYEAVRKILDYNLSVRHIRGGLARAEKYNHKKKDSAGNP